MLTCRYRELWLVLLLAWLVAGNSRAQGTRKLADIEAAIADLGNESAAVRAKARSAILRGGAAAITALRHAVRATDDVLPEHLFRIAEELGELRREVIFERGEGLGQKGWRVAWRPDDTGLAVLSDYGGRVHFFDQRLRASGDGFGDDVAYFAFGPGDRVAFNRAAGEIAIDGAQSGERVRIDVVDRPKMVWAPDGRSLATGHYGNVVDLWDVGDGSLIRQFVVQGMKGGLTPVFSPDGKLLVVGNRNGTAHVFEVETGELRHVLERRSTKDIVFTPDGKRIVVGYVDGKIGVWNAVTGSLVKLMDSELEEVFAFGWSADGRFLASAGRSGPILIWSGAHLAPVVRLESGSERTFSVAFRPDGKGFVAGGKDGVRLWHIRPRR